jgi:spermidine synthase
MIKRWLSYLFPIAVIKKQSSRSQTLEVTWNDGQLVLDSKNANYSFGSLQRILRYGLKEIGFEKVASMDEILVLGVAGGSVIQTLRKEIKHQKRITGIEIDEEVLEIAKTYFQLDEVENLRLIVYDAFEFVLRTKNKFDLIIIDVFDDIQMPNFLFETFFLHRLHEILNPHGKVLFNTMMLLPQHVQRNEKYILDATEYFTAHPLRKVENHNQIIILTKK